MKSEILKTLQILNEGGVILYPTDTIWGLGCDALNEKAVERLFQIKKRMVDKSVIVLIDDLMRVKENILTCFSKGNELLKSSDKPQTVIFPKAKGFPKGVLNLNESMAFRIPKHTFCQNLLSEFKRPLVSTSANVSGEETPLYFEEISQDIINAVDYVVSKDVEGNMTHLPSRIVLLNDEGGYSLIRS